MKRLACSFIFVEWFGPHTFEVNRVGQHQSGETGQAARWENVLNFVLGLLCDPMVDFVSGLFRFGNKVSLVDVGLVIGFGIALALAVPASFRE